jgi:hypothetical protein
VPEAGAWLAACCGICAWSLVITGCLVIVMAPEVSGKFAGPGCNLMRRLAHLFHVRSCWPRGRQHDS